MLSLVTLAAALAGTVAAASSPELARAGRRHLPSHRRLQAAPRSSLRRGLQSTVATLQMCPPAIGSDSVIYADVYDLPNLQDYRVSVCLRAASTTADVSRRVAAHDATADARRRITRSLYCMLTSAVIELTTVLRAYVCRASS